MWLQRLSILWYKTTVTNIKHKPRLLNHEKRRARTSPTRDTTAIAKYILKSKIVISKRDYS